MTPPPDELRKSGQQRADELRMIFSNRVVELCSKDAFPNQPVTVEHAELAALIAAEEIADTLRGSVRRYKKRNSQGAGA